MYIIVYCSLHRDIPDNHAGAGIFGGGQTSFSDIEPHPIANNGLLLSASDGLLLDCVSNSNQFGVGMITGLDGNTLPIGITGVWLVVNPFFRPGVLRLRSIYSSQLTAADQGIYTCTIPDSNDNQFIFNVGLYPSGFMGESQMNLLLSVFTICSCTYYKQVIKRGKYRDC